MASTRSMSRRERLGLNREDADEEEKAYKQEAMQLLKKSFPKLSVTSIQKTFSENSHDFPSTYRILTNIQAIVDNRAIAANAKEGHAKNLAPFLRYISPIILKHKRYGPIPRQQNQRLIRQLEGIPEFQGKRPANVEIDGVNQVDENKENVVNQNNNQEAVAQLKKPSDSSVPSAACLLPSTTAAAAAAAAPIVEHEYGCECCYVDYCFDDMVACSDGAHMYCKGCVKNYVSEQLYGNNRSDFRCMSVDGCAASFPAEMMEKALSPRTLKNVQKHSYRAEIAKSGMDSLWSCPKCDYIAMAEGGIFVECPGCHHQSCRMCKEAPHKDQTCEQAKSEKETANAHARMADAMTAAVMRSCPGCNTAIMKSSGCNKMTCTVQSCRTLWCYVCRQKIAPELGYNHFCRTPHCTHESCGKCVLFSNTDEDDRRARREAGMKEKTALGEVAENVGLLSPDKQTATDRKMPAVPQGQRFPNAAVGAAAVVPPVLGVANLGNPPGVAPQQPGVHGQNMQDLVADLRRRDPRAADPVIQNMIGLLTPRRRAQANHQAARVVPAGGNLAAAQLNPPENPRPVQPNPGPAQVPQPPNYPPPLRDPPVVQANFGAAQANPAPVGARADAPGVAAPQPNVRNHGGLFRLFRRQDPDEVINRLVNRN